MKQKINKGYVSKNQSLRAIARFQLDLDTLVIKSLLFVAILSSLYLSFDLVWSCIWKCGSKLLTNPEETNVTAVVYIMTLITFKLLNPSASKQISSFESLAST